MAADHRGTGRPRARRLRQDHYRSGKIAYITEVGTEEWITATCNACIYVATPDDKPADPAEPVSEPALAARRAQQVEGVAAGPDRAAARTARVAAQANGAAAV
jgi:hypothetical protein